MIFEEKTILVTGATGSMGKTFVRRVLTGELGTPKKVIAFSRDEAKQPTCVEVSRMRILL
jgi:UDP-glucose 4-epimerase